MIIVGYAIPGFLFAILLIILFAGGSFWDFFPLRGLWSDQLRQHAVLAVDHRPGGARSTISGTWCCR